MFRRRDISDAIAEERISFLILEPGNSLIPDSVAVSRQCKVPTTTSGGKSENTPTVTLGNDYRH